LAFKEPRNFIELDEANEAKGNEPQDHVSMEELEECLKKVNWFAKEHQVQILDLPTTGNRKPNCSKRRKIKVKHVVE
jgi:hypothetical protein